MRRFVAGMDLRLDQIASRIGFAELHPALRDVLDLAADFRVALNEAVQVGGV
jgi:hypothetical protein